jgi:hypothetical protein
VRVNDDTCASCGFGYRAAWWVSSRITVRQCMLLFIVYPFAIEHYSDHGRQHDLGDTAIRATCTCIHMYGG